MEDARGQGQVLTVVDRLPDGSLQHTRAGCCIVRTTKIRHHLK